VDLARNILANIFRSDPYDIICICITHIHFYILKNKKYKIISLVLLSRDMSNDTRIIVRG
jgi:hypothetical protein